MIRRLKTINWPKIAMCSGPLLAFLAILASSRWGAALGDDSYWYIKPARDVLAGNSPEFHPLYPPFLPIILSGLGFLGIDPAESVRYLNAVLFAVAVLLAFLIALRMSQSVFFSFLASTSILLSARLIQVFSSAMSEPLYLCLVLGCIYSVDRYMDERRLLWLVTGGVLAGLAVFTRYAGVSIVLAVALYLLIRKGQPASRRIRDISVYVVISAFPITAYVVRNVLTTGRPVGQGKFSWNLVKQFQPDVLIRNLADWIVPGRFVEGYEQALILLLLVGLAAIIGGYWMAYRERFVGILTSIFESRVLILLMIFVIVNMVMLSLARGFFSGGNPFNPRYLAPVQISVFLIGFAVVAQLYRRTGEKSQLLLRGTSLAFVAFLAARALFTVWALYNEGAGYSSRRWHISETIAYLNRRPETPLMSTANDGIYFWTGRRPLHISRQDSNASAKDFLCDTGGLLVIIDSVPPELYGVDHDSLVEGLTLEQKFSEGSIYRMDVENCD
jgi:hypothetical protein